MQTKVDTKPEMLTWALQRAGFNIDEFVKKDPRILGWISGEKKPTLKQLENFAAKVHVPFGFLLLDTPPNEDLPFPFFRTNGNSTEKVSINVYDTILQLQQRQNWLRDYLIDNEFEPLTFVGRFSTNTNPIEIATDIRKILRLDLEWASNFHSWEEALSHLASRVEENRIITVFNGVVGNNTARPIEVDECRGFVLVDQIAPFMFINNKDSKSAQLFTIAHELAHIWVGQSAGFDFRKLLPAENPIEILCDRVAAEFLVPESSFLRYWRSNPSIKSLARYFKVSEIVIARRALDLGKISKEDFFVFYDEYSNREFNRPTTSGGDFYRTTKVRLSLQFVAHLNHAVKSGQLLYRDAYRLSNLKGKTFEAFISKYF